MRGYTVDFEWVFKNVRSKDNFEFIDNIRVSRLGFKCIIDGKEHEDYFEYMGLMYKPCVFERIDFDHYMEMFKKLDNIEDINDTFDREIYSKNLEEFDREHDEDWDNI